MRSIFRAHRAASTCATLLVIMNLVGCGASQPVGKRADGVFYPDPPAPPRLQFLTSFSSTDEFKTPRKESFTEWVVGAPQQATSGGGEFASPYGMASHGNKLYLCDLGKKRVHILDLQTMTVSAITSDRIRNPVNITIDADATKYICDTAVGKVLVFDANDQFVNEIYMPTSWMPLDAAIRGDELFVTDAVGGKIEVWSKSGQHLRTISNKGRGVDQLLNPTNLAIGPDGRLYVVDTFQQIVKVFNPDNGQYLASVGQPGTQIGSFARPKGIAIAPDGTVFVSDAHWDVVQMFNAKGELLMLFGAPGREPWSMGLPAGLLIDRNNVDRFRSYLAADFEPEYLLFVVNQFGVNKVAVYAYGRDRRLPRSAYDVDEVAVARRREQLKSQAEAAPKQ